mgnify:CR=1 FL=1|jgi:hypothetical protein
MEDDMIFWDEMWNVPSKKLKKINKDENITKDRMDDTPVEPKD